jgi:hypothetical protein
MLLLTHLWLLDVVLPSPRSIAEGLHKSWGNHLGIFGRYAFTPS